MTTEHHIHCLRVLIETASPHLEALPAIRRADAYEGISLITKGVDNEISNKAETIAQQLRDAEVMQGEFALLLTSGETA
ncbi:MAG: hypothetical protein OJI67_07810 [Prosthecobacter sp.]|nr:hypothetical protein [Prosthecobacter sp.]